MPKGNMHHIATLDYGYWVRFYRGAHDPSRGKKTELYLHRTFKFSEFGGKRKALKAARQWRDEHLPVHQQNHVVGGVKKRGRPHREPRFDNSTDTVGVGRRTRVREDGSLYVCYFARWNEACPGEEPPTRSRTKSFAVSDGQDEDLVYQKARRHRKKMERIHYRK